MKLEQAIQSTKFRNDQQKAVVNLLYTAWWLKTVISRELKEFGLTHEQFNVLRILNGKYPDHACVKDIACRMIEKSSNVPRIIDRLEIKKLVKRTSSLSDKRETLITLTQSGIVLLEATTQKVDAVITSSLSISSEESIQLNHLLEKIRLNEI